MVFFDSHCHLQDERIKNDITGIINRSTAAGVKFMLCCGSTESDWPEVLAIADRYSNVIPAIGLHPWYIDSRSTRWLPYLEELLRSDPKIAVGEIGLDRIMVSKNTTEQMKVFREQIRLAQKLERPVSMHCRKAWGILLQYLRTERPTYRGIVIHSYSGPMDLVKELQSYQITLSFSGSITYEHNHRCRASAAMAHSRHLILETDSPDIAPNGFQGFNEPSTLPLIAKSLAELRGITIEEVAATTTTNAQALFNA